MMAAGSRKRRVGLIGFGFIGRKVYERMSADTKGPVEVAFVHNRSDAAVAGVPAPLRLKDLAGMRHFAPDLVVEMAHPSYTQQWGEQILRRCSYLPLSVTALADDGLRERLEKQARECGTMLAVPHGALMGLDTLREWRKEWEEVTISFYKHASNIDFSESGIDPAAAKPGAVLYEGAVRGIAALFPRNVDTMVTCALATVGLDRCRARLVAAETPNVAVAEVVARGRGGSLLTMRKEQPAQGVCGMEIFESQYASILRAAGLSEPLCFV